MVVNGINGTDGGPEASRVKQELDRDTRDVSGLWNEALTRYKGIAGVDLVSLQSNYRSVDDMIQYGTVQMNNFHKFRHDQKKVDKLRSLFVANMGLIEKGAQQLVAAATPAFPPAAAIGTAFTYMLNACRQVSADYDVVTAFFEDMNAFLQRISILESRLPSYPAYRNCLMDVFTSLLEMCGFATRYIELGRFKKWIINLMKGEDSELGGARKNMDVRLRRLQDATEYAILGNTEEIQRMNIDLQKNQDLQLEMAESQNKMLKSVMESQENVNNELQSIHKLLVMFDERRKDETPKQAANKAASQNKPPTSNRVRSSLPESISPEIEYKNIKDSFIGEKTGTWILSEPVWNKWVTQDTAKKGPKILAISGPPGSGKSHLAVSAYDSLLKASKNGSGDTAVGMYFFRESTKDLYMFYNAIHWLVIQLAEQNALLCEKINVELAREDVDIEVYNWEDVWNRLVKPFCGPASKTRLQLVLDGLDEVGWTQRDDMIKFLTMVSESTDLNVSILCTTRPELLPKLKELGADTIEVTKEKQSADLKALIWHHLENDGGLRKFARYMKQRISTALEEKADGMLYAEHTLRQFNMIAREPLILKQLANSMPKDVEGLYENILADLQQRIRPNQHASLKTLLAWLSFSRQPLSLGEYLGLLKLLPGDTLSLEEELQGQQLSRLLKIAGFEERSVDYYEDSSLEEQNPDSAYDDANLPLRFQERSMRGFFRSGKPGETGLRTFLSEAHLQIFVTCSDIICGRLQDVHEGLKKYAAASWAFHLSWSGLLGTQIPEEDKLSAFEALGRIMSSEENGASKIIESLGVDYGVIKMDFQGDGFRTFFQHYAGEMTKRADKLSPAAAAWAAEVATDKTKALIPLARAHVVNTFQAQDMKLVLRSYNFARTALKMTSLGHFIKEDEDEDAGSSDDGLEDQGGQNSLEDILGIADTFPEIPKDANAHWAIAGLLHHSRHSEAALQQAEDGLKKASEPLDQFRILDLTSNIQFSLEDFEAAFASIQKGLAIPSIPPNLLRRGYITRAKAEEALERLDDSIASFEAARHADPGEPMAGDVLQNELQVYLLKDSDADTINAMKRWTTLEKLAFMTWKYDEDVEPHENFRRLGGRTGDHEFLVQAYEEVIELLDRVDAGAPIRFELAQVYCEVMGEADKAKAVLGEILDASSTGYPWRFTNEEPQTTLTDSLLYYTDIIYEQFRATGDRELKAKLFAEAKALSQKTLAHSVTSSNSDLLHRTVVLARMARKVSTALEFQDTLQAAFEDGCSALEDAVGWNDATTLAVLAEVLLNLPGLEKEAKILASAIFSQLDPKVWADDDSEEEGETGADDDDDDSDDDGEDSIPTDEGDISGESIECSGECDPQKKWRAWKGRTIYQCLICSQTWLCEDCHAKRQAYNAGEPSKVGTNYCGKDHKYIQGPIPGWKGIKDGVLTIEGEEPVAFTNWLAELREKKWKAAWERFWLAED